MRFAAEKNAGPYRHPINEREILSTERAADSARSVKFQLNVIRAWKHLVISSRRIKGLNDSTGWRPWNSLIRKFDASTMATVSWKRYRWKGKNKQLLSSNDPHQLMNLSSENVLNAVEITFKASVATKTAAGSAKKWAKVWLSIFD